MLVRVRDVVNIGGQGGSGGTEDLEATLLKLSQKLIETEVREQGAI